jgi:1,4-dihydroxy-2-naphthoyl-CoA hydrolase
MNAQTSAPSVFKKAWTVQNINELHIGSMCSLVGIEFTERGDNYLMARMPIDQRTRQPVGILHGGASVTLAETLGSVAAWLCLDDGWNAVGLDINANHVRAVRDGWVYGTARPTHIGRTTQIWQIDIVNDDGKLVCTSRLTIAVVPARLEPKFEQK